jgi:hypothetical protein
MSEDNGIKQLINSLLRLRPPSTEVQAAKSREPSLDGSANTVQRSAGIISNVSSVGDGAVDTADV